MATLTYQIEGYSAMPLKSIISELSNALEWLKRLEKLEDKAIGTLELRVTVPIEAKEEQ